MKKILITVIGLLIVVSCATQKPASYEMDKRYFIAVAEFRFKTPKGEKSNRESELARQKIMDMLLDSGRIRLIERDKLDAIIKEQQLGETGLVDADSAAKIGKLAGVDAVLIGEIVPQRLNKKDKGSDPEFEVTISGRLINTSTGEVLASEVFSCKKRIALKAGEQRPSLEEMKKMLDEAVEGFVTGLVPKIPEKK
ncbi:MAG TPA: CsgG/HfaB family protein [Spirochaetota bacterium]|nr:CsgG/HfaB family protein [Spirochaetota bacterium]